MLRSVHVACCAAHQNDCADAGALLLLLRWLCRCSRWILQQGGLKELVAECRAEESPTPTFQWLFSHSGCAAKQPLLHVTLCRDCHSIIVAAPPLLLVLTLLVLSHCWLCLTFIPLTFLLISISLLLVPHTVCSHRAH